MRPGSVGPRFAEGLERLEERLAMAAEVVYDFWADAGDASAVEQLATLYPTAPTHQQTGVSGAHNDYGFIGSGQTVAVIDTGIAWDHYALGRGYGEGYRIVGGWDFTEENDANPYDDGPAGFHGTHVAGIIGSDDSRYSGVAPGVDLVALRVFNDQGAGKFEWVEKALRWVHENRNAFENPITTVNLSLGAKWNAETLPNWATLEDELKLLYDDGIFISVAAGNDFASQQTPGLAYPAVSQYVVAVGSVTSSGVFSSFSQRADRILAAPGQSITSTVPDWLYGGNGKPNDYGTASGTSMAAPYVAGAAVLVREAMEFVGYVGITQDTIYDHLRNTADVFYDTATNANYFRINVGRAIDALMPADEAGGTVATGQQVGRLDDQLSLNGVIGKKSDVDTYTFTAGASGIVTIDVAGRDRLAADVTIIGASAETIDGKLSFRVTAGEQYSLQLATRDGIGHYTVDVALAAEQASTPPVTAWGEVAFAHFHGQSIAGESWYQITASRSGILTIETMLASGGNVRVELLNANQQVVGAANASGAYGRLDATVSQGDTYFVRVVGDAGLADFRLTNLVAQAGSTVQVFGTKGSDTFSFAAGATQHQVTVNGVSYQFEARIVTTFQFHGQGGFDTAVLAGTSQNETARFSETSASLAGARYQATVTGATDVVILGGGGVDRLDIVGTAGNDVVDLAYRQASFISGGLRLRAFDFWTVDVDGGAGNDEVRLTDTAGNDRFAGYATHATLTGAGYSHQTRNFERVIVTATGGNDSAYLYDSAGNDSFVASPTEATLSGQGFSNRAIGFDRVYAFASGGYDTATLYDSAGSDRFYGRGEVSWLTGTTFYNSATGFERTVAHSSGGVDTAWLYDTPGSDVLTVGAAQVTLRGGTTEQTAAGFARVYAYSTGGKDEARFIESTSRDTFTQSGTSGTLSGDGYTHTAFHFARVSALSPQQVDQAFFQGLGTDSPLDDGEAAQHARTRLTELLVGYEFALGGNQHGTDNEAVDAVFESEGQ